jgi:5-methylcytosine-specific restriction endonuclease McrA
VVKGYGAANGWQWQRMKPNVLRAHPLCDCGSPITIVHHRRRRVDGATDGLDNLKPICKSCHDARHGRGGVRRISLIQEKNQ